MLFLKGGCNIIQGLTKAGSQAGSAALRLMQIVFSSFLFHDDGPSSMQSVLSVLKGLIHCLLLSDEGTPPDPCPTNLEMNIALTDVSIYILCISTVCYVPHMRFKLLLL